jgi:uncharacterized protein (TIGR02588 family)
MKQNRDEDKRAQQKDESTGVAPRTKAEWVSLLISLLVLAGVVGTVIALWLRPTDNPPRFRIERGAVRSDADHYHLPIKLINDGDATGAQVTVEGTLRGGNAEETATTTFDFVPARSRVEGVLVFSSEPAAATVRVVSYQQP